MTLRPCDAKETEEAWKIAIERKDGPTVLVLSRQISQSSMLKPSALTVPKSAYVLSDAPNGHRKLSSCPQGAEVHLALEAQAALQEAGTATRVVSMPSWELFAAQDAAYQEVFYQRR